MFISLTVRCVDYWIVLNVNKISFLIDWRKSLSLNPRSWIHFDDIPKAICIINIFLLVNNEQYFMVISLLYRRFKTLNSFLSHFIWQKKRGENGSENVLQKKSCKALLVCMRKFMEIPTAINKAFGFQTMITNFSIFDD